MRVAYFLPQAEWDVEDIVEFIAADALDPAIRFLHTVRSDAERLAEMPGMGPLYGLRHSALADIRFWPITDFRKYLLFYRPSSVGIEVVRVLHGARNIEQIMGL